jgi:hypothetical protein
VTAWADRSVQMRARWAALLVVVITVVAGLIGFAWGDRVSTTTEAVTCHAGTRMTTCTLGDGWDVSVPFDVGWTDARGYHEGNRPACLRSRGDRVVEGVGVTWTEVEVDGRSWRQVLQMQCPA